MSSWLICQWEGLVLVTQGQIARMSPHKGATQSVAGPRHFRGWVQVSGPVLSQSRKALARLAEPHHWCWARGCAGNRKRWVTPHQPLMARSLCRRFTNGKTKRREKRVSLIYGEPKKAASCVYRHDILHCISFSFLPCFLPFFFFFIQGPGHCFWTSLSRTDTLSANEANDKRQYFNVN